MYSLGQCALPVSTVGTHATWKQWWTPALVSVSFKPAFCEIWELPPTRKGVFYLADDRPVEWDVGEARTVLRLPPLLLKTVPNSQPQFTR